MLPWNTVYSLVETETRSNNNQITNYDTQKNFGMEWYCGNLILKWERKSIQSRE